MRRKSFEALLCDRTADSLGLGHDAPHLQHGIRIQTDRIDSILYEEARELRVITWRLTADADLPALCFRRPNDCCDQSLNGFVPLIEQPRNKRRIAIESER